MKLSKRGMSYAILSSIIGSVASILAAGGTKLIHPVLFAALGGIVSGLILLVLLFVSKKKLEIIKKVSKYRKDFAKLILFRPILGQAILLAGFSLTDPIKVVFFTKLEPIFVLLWGYLLFGHKIKRKDIAIILTLITGGILLSTGGEFGTIEQTNIGDILIVISLAFLSYSYYSASKLSKKLGSRFTNTVSGIVGGIVLLPIAFFMFNANIINIEPIAWKYFFGFVIGFNVIALTLWYAALKSVKGWIVSAVRAIGPVSGAIAAFLLFGNVLNPVQIVGATIILMSTVLLAKFHK